jgi:putative pyruvate formate lyase activating enzyme
MQDIITALHNQDIKPVIIYNTNSYEEVEILQSLEGVVDVYLADMRYGFDDLAKAYSDCNNYSSKAIAAIKEMYRQKGSSVLTDADDVIESGLIMRVLCLPKNEKNTFRILEMIADEISTNIYLSLLSQYFPPFNTLPYPLNQRLSQTEYNRIANYAYELGFHKIQMQDLTSAEVFQPDFSQNNPF